MLALIVSAAVVVAAVILLAVNAVAGNAQRNARDHFGDDYD